MSDLQHVQLLNYSITLRNQILFLFYFIFKKKIQHNIRDTIMVPDVASVRPWHNNTETAVQHVSRLQPKI